MKLVRVPQTDGLVGEVKRRFADFNRSRPVKGRRYPDELRQLVCQAAAQGCKVPELSRLTGLSASGVRLWLPKVKPVEAATARRLEVVAGDVIPAPVPPLTTAIVVRLPSGVTIELPDARSLTRDLLSALGASEVRHAAAR